MVPFSPAINYHLKSEVCIHYASLSAIFNLLHHITIKNRSQSTSAIKVATINNMDDFHYEGKLSYATTKSTPFAVSKDKWDTEEDTGKSMKNVFYILWYAKRHVSG